MSYFYIVLLTLLVLRLIYDKDNGKYKKILITGFLLRILILMIDLNHWMVLPHSGMDSEWFHKIPVYNVTHSYDFKRCTYYTDFITVLYYISDCSRVFAQYFNVFFGMCTLLIIRRFLSQINITQKSKQLVMMLATFAPTMVILSGILLREAWIQFFATLSILYFTHWFTKGQNSYIIYCLLSVIAAAIMHSGMIALAIGYSVAFICYNPRAGRTQFSSKSILSILILIAFTAFIMNNMELFNDKQGKMHDGDSDKAIMASYKTIGGGSDYLTWLPIDNPVMAWLFTPLKMFYFLFSPIPLDWRGTNDIIAFVTDSCVYIYLTWAIYKLKLKNKLFIHFKKYTAIVLFITVFIFGFGSTNAGQAMRHRAKILPVMIMTLTVCLSERKQNKTCTLPNPLIS